MGIFEELVSNRGITEQFLYPEYEGFFEELLQREKMPDLEIAGARMLEAAKKQEKVMVYGDYDVDGVMSSALMAEILQLIGVKQPIIMLPDRFIDGYGMSKRMVQRAKDEGVSLVVTVDCGSNNGAIISELKEAGIQTIVTDHHEILGEIPEAVAVVNPKRLEKSCLRELCGAGVAFFVALWFVQNGIIPKGREKWMLDLVLIGTICDSMEINLVNRVLTYYGMKVIQKTKRVGLVELLSGLGVKKVDSTTIGYMIGPRINAAGRMASAEDSLRLVMAKNKVSAIRGVAALEEFNSARKKAQQAAIDEILEKGMVDGEEPVILVAGEWEEGVLGIIAGRLVEEFRKPAFVLGEIEENGEKMLKGSGRSFGDFNLAKVITHCLDLLATGGGHAGACGVKLRKENFSAFKEEVNRYYQSLKLSDQEKYLKTKGEIQVSRLSELSVGLYEEIMKLEPFGPCNEVPIFELVGATVLGVFPIGTEGKHLKIEILGEDAAKMKIVVFSASEKWFKILPQKKYNFLVELTKNEWNGTCAIEGRGVDFDEY